MGSVNHDRDAARLWEHCRRTVEGLELPDPFDVGVFIASLARERGRPIDLVPVTARPNLPCGLVVTTDRADWIVYRADTTAVHRRHILLHEAAHLVCGHAERDGAAAPPGAPMGAGAGAAAAAALMPHLSDDLIRNVLGRTVYSEPDEREAELVASLILRRVQRRGRRGTRTGDGRGSSRLDSVFGFF